MRRSKRKASAVVTEKLAEATSATAADATCTSTDANEDASDNEYISEDGEMSDGENALHGPCNVLPIGQDEDTSFFFFACVSSVIYLSIMPKYPKRYAQELHYW